MSENHIETYDREEGYCRMLGHYVPFQYCRTLKDGMPCHRILDCWFERLPVEDFIAEHYSADEQAKMFEPPKAKITSLLEIIEKAKKK
jgi:hypothetical protein